MVKPLFRLEFVPHGTTLEPERGKLALDVGNRICPGVIDHHQPGGEEECTASLIYRYPRLVLDHLQGATIGEVTVVTHLAPDLDAVTATYFAHCLLAEGKLPRFAQKLASYVQDVDRGVCFRKPGELGTLYGIFIGICEQIKEERDRGVSAKEDEDILRVQWGFRLLDFVLSRLSEHMDLHQEGLFKGPHPFQKAQQIITPDYKIYLEDLARCEKVQLRLPSRRGKEAHIVDGLLVKDPKSVLFRFWARGDNLHSPQGHGFTFLAVNYQDRRFVISVDPHSHVYLKGLGEMLEREEVRKRSELGMEREGPPRPGYDGPDPWYDGRNPLHSYTIVDTPRDGTVLTWEEIKTLIMNPERWWPLQ